MYQPVFPAARRSGTKNRGNRIHCWESGGDEPTPRDAGADFRLPGGTRQFSLTGQRYGHTLSAGRVGGSVHRGRDRRRASSLTHVLRNHPVRAAVQPSEAGRCFLGHAHLYFFLASGGCGAQRPGILGFLRRRHCRAGGRKSSTLVHPGGDVVFLRGPLRLRRELLDVHTRRRVSRREGSARRKFRQTQRVGADVRLHPDRPDLRSFGGAVHYRAAERTAGCGGGAWLAALVAVVRCALGPADERNRCAVCGGCDDLLLVAKHQRHRGVDRQGAKRHAGDDGDGGAAAVVGIRHRLPQSCQTATAAGSGQSAFFPGRAGIPERDRAGENAGAVRHPDGFRTLGAGDERRGNARSSQSRDRAPEAEEPEARSHRHRDLQLHLYRSRHVAGYHDYSGRRARARLPRQFDCRHGDVHVGTPGSADHLPGLRGYRRIPDSLRGNQYFDHWVDGRDDARRGRRRADGLVSQAASPLWDELSHH